MTNIILTPIAGENTLGGLRSDKEVVLETGFEALSRLSHHRDSLKKDSEFLWNLTNQQLKLLSELLGEAKEKTDWILSHAD